MSFRAFVYYCMVCGGWAAFLGWALGRLTASSHPIGAAGIKGMFLGMLVALALGVVEALSGLSLSGIVRLMPRVFVAGLVGTLGGLVGGIVGQALYGLLPLSIFFIFGWTVTGLLVGASVGVFDVLLRFVRREVFRGAWRKIINGILGGVAGGLLGGILSLLLKDVWSGLFGNDPPDDLWSPSAMGFVALGMCLGLMIGLAQVLLRESWLRVEAGFRPGRELILTKPEITIGRAESCDLGLFGDAAVEPVHARLMLQDDCYLLADAGSATGTFLNEERILAPTPLRSGDAIRVGHALLHFGERRKQTT
jgi:hypothetical protein